MDPLSPTGINGPWQTSPTNRPARLYQNPDHSSASASSPTQASGSSSAYTRSALPTSSSLSADGFRDPKVFGAPGMALLDPALTPSQDEASGPGRDSGDGGRRELGKGRERGFLRVRITGLERNRKDLLVRFDASVFARRLIIQTNLSNFRTTMYRNIQRSYAEFQKFAEQAQVTSPQNDRLVRIALQRWFTRICEDPALLLDEELRSFVESDFGYSPIPPPTARRSTSAAAAVPLAFTAAISKVVRRGPLDEDDELASAKGALERLETNWGTAATAVSSLGKARRGECPVSTLNQALMHTLTFIGSFSTHEMRRKKMSELMGLASAIANQDVGSKLISLSTVESDYFLAAAERKSGRAMEVLSGVAGAQAASENVVLSDSLGYQALNARAAKDALALRTQLLDDSQTATKSAITKRRNVERLKGSSNINSIKVDDAISEMEDANALEIQLTKQLSAISSNLHLSLRQHSRNTHEDVALALLENARLTVGFHKHVLRELEAVRPDLAKVGSEKGADILTAAASVQVRAPESAYYQQNRDSRPPPPTHLSGAPPVLPALTSHPHMTGSRPYDSPPRRPNHASIPTSQSMFLPPSQPDFGRPSSTGPPQGRQQPPSQGAPPASSSPMLNSGAVDPLGGGMAQSMMLPSGHGQARPATTGRAQGRRLDERQAAKLLAGGF